MGQKKKVGSKTLFFSDIDHLGKRHLGAFSLRGTAFGGAVGHHNWNKRRSYKSEKLYQEKWVASLGRMYARTQFKQHRPRVDWRQTSMTALRGSRRGGSRSTPQAENQENRSVRTRSGITREEKCREHISSFRNVLCRTAVTSSTEMIFCWKPLYSTVCMTHGGLPAASVRFCNSEAIANYVLCHATVVSSCTRQWAYPQQAVLRGVLWVAARFKT